MAHKIPIAITTALLFLAQLLIPVAAAELSIIENISVNKHHVHTGESLKVTWNINTERLNSQDLETVRVALIPESGVDCQGLCPEGFGEPVSTSTNGGLWQSYILTSDTTLQTDYVIRISIQSHLYGEILKKSENKVTISNTASPNDLHSIVTPAISGSGWAPSVGVFTREVDGFSAKIQNFNTSYTWSYSVSKGVAGIDGEGNFTVHSLKLGESAQVTIQTVSSTGLRASSTFTERALLAPPFSHHVRVTQQRKNGFDFVIDNIDTYYLNNYTFETRNGKISGYSISENVRTYSVTNLLESSTALIHIFSNRPGYLEGYSRVVGSSLALPPAPVASSIPTSTPEATTTPTPTPVSVVSQTPTSTPTPTPTASIKKTILCIKAKSSKKVTGINPKCPKGFREKPLR